jgi:hypothetical protein
MKSTVRKSRALPRHPTDLGDVDVMLRKAAKAKKKRKAKNRAAATPSRK